jgi:REP element-mobilizing transposase RayT
MRFAEGSTMSPPRRIIANATHLVTRRSCQRTFRLRPSPETTRIFKYCLARAMEKTGILLHAVCVMSNHHHLVVTDPRGVLPDFLRELHRLTSKALNTSQRQRENLWAAEPCSVVQLTTDEDIEDKIAYVTANPVAAGLVQQPEEWPGFVAWGEQTLSVERPKSYFLEDGACPPVLQLRLTPPPMVGERAGREAQWMDRVRRTLTKKVAEAHETVRKSGRVFLGRAAVLATSFLGRPSSYEEKRDRNPTFAAMCSAVRDELRKIEQGFRAAYREALEEWRGGEAAVQFPLGTWAMRMVPGISIAKA